MADINDLSVTDASNTARFPEGMARASVNNAARSLEGILARWHKDNNGSLATGGTSTAITVTLNQSSIAAWYDGLTFAARITTTCGATPTINPTGSGALGAKSLYWSGTGTQLAAGDLTSTAVAWFMYEATSDKVYVFAAPPAPAAGSETVAGVLELATQAEVNTGSDTARAITPAGLTGWTPAVGTVTALPADKVLLADASASGVLKQALISDFGGKRIQRVATTKTDTSTIAITAGTYSDVTDMAVTITATSGNRIVIEGSLTLGVQTGPEVAYLILLRGSTVISPVGASPSNRKAASWAVEVSANSRVNTLYFRYEDTAPDGNANTYKLQMTAQTTENWHVNRSESDTDNNTFARMGSWITASEYTA